MNAMEGVPAKLLVRENGAPPISRDDSSRHELSALTGLRFLASASILIGHSTAWLAAFSDSALLSKWVGEPVAVFGMPLFFVLSGFVIHYNYCTLFTTTKLRWAAANFIGHRVARLWPLYLFGLLIGGTAQMLVAWLGRYNNELLIVSLHDLTATQSWFYAIFFNQLLLYFGFGLGWSVSTEVFFYVCYIFVARPISILRRPQSALIACLICACGALAISYAAAKYRLQIDIFGSHYVKGAITDGKYSWSQWLLYHSPYMRIFEFILGAFSAQLYLVLNSRKPSRFEHNIGQALLICALAILALISFIYSTGRGGPVFGTVVSNFGCAAPIALLIFCTSRYQSRIRDWLGSQRLKNSGELSYSIYAMHTWILWIFLRPAVPITALGLVDAVLRIIVGITLTIFLATATYRIIEVPGRRRLRVLFETMIVERLGTREQNLLAPAAMIKKWHMALSLLGLAAFLAACVFYQFNILPKYP